MTTALPSASDFAAQLQSNTMACRIGTTKPGVRRSLNADQIAQVAEGFDAERSALSATKRLFNTREETYRAVLRVREMATTYWKQVSVPYPETGVRLIRKDRLADFVAKMEVFKAEMASAAAKLQEAYPALVQAARNDLGSLFNVNDYPERIDTLFSLSWDFPSVEPPAYLRQMHPELYEQEVHRIRAQFEEAVRMTEENFADQFAQMIAHLGERLTGEQDGKAKVFRDSAVENLTEFFNVFKDMNTGSNAKLTALVEQAQGLVGGLAPKDLRKNEGTRKSVADGLASIQMALEGMMVPKPTRRFNIEMLEDVAPAEKVPVVVNEAEAAVLVAMWDAAKPDGEDEYEDEDYDGN